VDVLTWYLSGHPGQLRSASFVDSASYLSGMVNEYWPVGERRCLLTSSGVALDMQAIADSALCPTTGSGAYERKTNSLPKCLC